MIHSRGGRFVLCAVLVVLACAGCDSSSPDNRREVQRPAPYHDQAPIRDVDKAIQTEAQAAFATIFQQIRVAAARATNTTELYQSFNGPLDAARLGRIGITEAEIGGTHYVASDYTISISGRTMTITASKPGTRGFTSSQYTLP